MVVLSGGAPKYMIDILEFSVEFAIALCLALLNLSFVKTYQIIQNEKQFTPGL